MTQFQLNNATAKVGKTVKVKVRLKADGVEGAAKFRVQWNANFLKFNAVQLAVAGAVITTNTADASEGKIGILVNPVPNAFPASKVFTDLVVLEFEAVAPGTTPVIFGGVPFENYNNVSHITNGSLLKAKWTGGRVTVKG